MQKFQQILKNVLIFLVIFLIINYIMQSFLGKKEENAALPKTLIITPLDTEFARTKIITVELFNNTEKDITIKNECPEEPFNVYKYNGKGWDQITANPEIDCAAAKDIVVAAGKKTRVAYNNWNHALFYEGGRFKVTYAGLIDGKEETIESTEFTVVEEGLLSKLWWGILFRPIYNGMIFLIDVLPLNSLGVAIILITILIRTILLIPSQRALVSQRKMQELQPRLNKIKETHKGDQQKIAQETMALWKEAKVNPFGSCLPLLFQLPFLIAVFYVIKDGLNPDHTFMLYGGLKNFSLSDINVNFLNILDLTKPNKYVLPIIIGGLQFIQMKIAMAKSSAQNQPKNEMAMANNMMVYFMPVMIAVFTASLPAGVGLYWGTSTLYGIVQQFFVNKEAKKHLDNEPKVRVISN